MKNKPKIGIIGFGFVGRAIAHGFLLHANTRVYDKYQEGLDSLEDAVNHGDVLFVCVPTPADDNGKQDNSILEEIMEEIDKVAVTPKIIVLKSTVIVGTTKYFQGKYPRHTIVHIPEFLTERQAKLDFINTARIIIGGDAEKLSRAFHPGPPDTSCAIYSVKDFLVDLMRSRFPHTPIYIVSPEAAEFVKYMCNSFFAMKVSFMNECFDACQYLEIDFEEVKKMFLSDMRIGNSHTDVPGHDGRRGYGGKCFPKDVLALTNWGKENEIHFTMLEATNEVNERVREERDWEKIRGATTKFNYGESEE
jgi:UDPglucose 6-dehydrogenase